MNASQFQKLSTDLRSLARIIPLHWGAVQNNRFDSNINMFEIDHSAARGKMAVRRLIVFKHSKELGDCPAYKLFDAVEVKKNEEVEYPRKYGDYTVAVHRDQIPETVEVSEKI